MKAPPARLPVWRYLARLATYRPFMALAAVFLVGLTMFYFLPLLPGLIVREVFNRLTGDAAAGFNLWTLFALLVVIAIVNQIGIAGAVATEISMHNLTETLLRKNLLARILEYPGARALPASPGEAISRLRDDVSAVPQLLTWIFDPIEQLLVTVVGLAILVRISPWLTLAVVVPLAVVVVIANLATRRIERYRRESHEAIAGVTGLIGEIFGAVQAVKVAGTEQHVVAHLERLNEARRAANLRDLVFSRFLESLSTNTAAIGTGVVLLVAAQAMQSPVGGKALTVGDFTIFVSYLGYLNFMTTMFGNFMIKVRQVRVSLERLIAILPGVPPERLVEHGPVYLWGELPPLEGIPDGDGAPLENLTARGLSYRYPETGRGITNIDLNIQGRLVHRHRRPDRLREDHPAAGLAGAAAAGCG